MSPSDIAVLLAAGVFVGFAGGMLGVGGAFITTPVQFMVFTGMGLPEDLAVKLAFGTSLLVVLPTAASGAWRHHRQGAVRWRVALIMGVCALVFAVGGATLASHLPGGALKIAFGVLVLASAARMLFSGQPRVVSPPVCPAWLCLALAAPVGFIVGLLGIGGGIVLVPLMVMVLRFEIHEAIATSIGVMIFSSIGGIIGYIVNGLGVAGLPDNSFGYVNLTSWLLLALPSIATAQLGALTSHRLPAGKLKYIYVVGMFYIGLRMIGVFEWLGWPL